MTRLARGVEVVRGGIPFAVPTKRAGGDAGENGAPGWAGFAMADGNGRTAWVGMVGAEAMPGSESEAS